MEAKKLTLEDIMFPLDTKEVYADFGDNKFTKISGKKALVNVSTKEPISIIGHDYEIITNKEAYEYGKICLKNLFKINNDSEIVIRNIYSPASKSFCHIDLILRNNQFRVVSDDYIPFVRITNSYNMMYSLSFRVGILRLVCTNGLMMEEDLITYKYSHVRGAKEKLNLQIYPNEYSITINRYKTAIKILSEKELPEIDIFVIFCKAFELYFDLNNQDKVIKARAKHKLDEYRNYFDKKISRYINELGNNFYSLFNVITDFATTNGFDDQHSIATTINSRQTKAGKWLNEISNLLRNVNIDYSEYLKNYLELLKN
jgi:hypothetical protein